MRRNTMSRPAVFPLSLADVEVADIDKKAVMRLVGVSDPKAFAAMLRAKVVPPPDLILGPRTYRWRASTVKRWLAAQAAGQQGGRAVADATA
jgi:predicted DNA-binding transcriptional regulator AlpA